MISSVLLLLIVVLDCKHSSPSRGTWPIEDQQTHTRAVAQQDVAAAVRSLNESDGYERWRVVPYEELNR